MYKIKLWGFPWWSSLLFSTLYSQYFFPSANFRFNFLCFLLLLRFKVRLCILDFSNANLREGNGTPLQYSCLENPMDGEFNSVNPPLWTAKDFGKLCFCFHLRLLKILWPIGFSWMFCLFPYICGFSSFFPVVDF